MTCFFSTAMDLGKTLECGQCFRWKKASDGSWHGTAYGKSISVRQGDGGIFIDTSSEADRALWRSYFDLDTDYASICRQLCTCSPVLACAAEENKGIHILCQEPWETLCSFILSQNNNIPRIKGIIERLCILLGDPLEGGDYSFPAPSRIAPLAPEDLSSIRSGFRAKYLIDAAKKVSSGELDLSSVFSLPADEAKKALTGIYGVGTKVADCVLLYGFHRLESFPMDVWMIRTMQTLLPGKSPQEFGDCAGVAQQYLYHYSRCHTELFTSRS